MGYPLDLDEYTEKRLEEELENRLQLRLRGRCDYCKRDPKTKPCKFEDRHRDPRSIETNHRITWRQVVRSASPRRLSDDEVDYILWNRTGFPEYWDIPADGKTPEECCRKQLAEYFGVTVNNPIWTDDDEAKAEAEQ